MLSISKASDVDFPVHDDAIAAAVVAVA